MKRERLIRLQKGAPDYTRRAFAKHFIEALDRLGIEPGEEFLIAPVHEQPSLDEIEGVAGEPTG